MSMNILVETRVAPRFTFETENPVLFPGEIAINEEGFSSEENSGVKIGDGFTTWNDLDYLPVTSEIVGKWSTIAKGTTNSRLVTLPDFNFAYSIIQQESNAMLEEIVDTTIINKNYLQLTEKLTSDDSKFYSLNIESKGVLGMLFDIVDANTPQLEIDKLIFKNSEENNIERHYFLRDGKAQEKLLTVESDIRILKENINLLSESINKVIDNKLILFSTESHGLVKAPTQTDINEDRFLSAKNTWEKIRQYATALPMSTTDNRTIAQAIQEVADKGLTIESFNSQNEDVHYVTTIKSNNDKKLRYNTGVFIQKGVLMGAAWNDYAECRTTLNIEGGRVVVENGDDTLSISTERLMLGGNIVSDTYGMLIGKTDNAKTPIALCGRVLAYPNEDRDEYYAGAPVCTGPNGTVSLMSKEEVLHYPECIIGYVSAIPTYEEWNGKKVNGRIWIKVS